MKTLCRKRVCLIVPCVSSYRWVHFSRSVLFCQPHQQLFTHFKHSWMWKTCVCVCVCVCACVRLRTCVSVWEWVITTTAVMDSSPCSTLTCLIMVTVFPTNGNGLGPGIPSRSNVLKVCTDRLQNNKTLTNSERVKRTIKGKTERKKKR